MRHPRTVAAGALALATAAIIAAPVAASASPAPHFEPLEISAAVAAKAQVDLGRPTGLGLCGLAERPVLAVLDDVRVLFCVAPAVAADLTAKAAVEPR